jgi:hypothetical protein
MRRELWFHHGVDDGGGRCWRMRSAAEIRRCRERQKLQPKIVALAVCCPGREVWRNGMHRRRWTVLVAQLRGDRRCFLTTLKRPPLVPPTLPF